MKIKCYGNLYTGKRIENQVNKALEDIMERRFRMGLYLIVLPEENKNQNQLEMFSSSQLRQPAYDDADLFIVGIAEGKEEAKVLTQQILQDTLDETGGTDMRSFLMQKQSEFDQNRG